MFAFLKSLVQKFVRRVKSDFARLGNKKAARVAKQSQVMVQLKKPVVKADPEFDVSRQRSAILCMKQECAEMRATLMDIATYSKQNVTQMLVSVGSLMYTLDKVYVNPTKWKVATLNAYAYTLETVCGHLVNSRTVVTSAVAEIEAIHNRLIGLSSSKSA